MLIKKFNTTKCIAGCKIFNDISNYLYWENRKVTNDEIDIINFLNSNNRNNNLSILHIGIGNSFLASKLNNYKEINVLNLGTLDLSDNNNFYILVPAQATRCSKGDKKNTYICPVTQHFKNGVNVTAFPFYLANDSDTGDNLSEYYELFNNTQSDDSKTS